MSDCDVTRMDDMMGSEWEPSCRGCDTDDLALKYCAGCGGVFCDSCINYLHAMNDYDNGDWFCKKCAEGMKEIE